MQFLSSSHPNFKFLMAGAPVVVPLPFGGATQGQLQIPDELWALLDDNETATFIAIHDAYVLIEFG